MIGPHGQKRPADTLANALLVARLMAGEAEEEYVDTARRAAARTGGQARAAALTPERRSEIALHAANARNRGVADMHGKRLRYRDLIADNGRPKGHAKSPRSRQWAP